MDSWADISKSWRRTRAGGLRFAAIIAVTALSMLVASSDAFPQDMAPPDWKMTGMFPPGFLFGVATSSHQVEGGNTNNDWSVFERRGDVADSGAALNHRDLDVLAGDLDLAKGLGITAYRFSLEWSRIEPAMDVFDQSEIGYYKQVIDMIRARGMTPIVGLYHFTTPKWLLDPKNHSTKPGWAADDGRLLGNVELSELHPDFIVDRFTRYVAKMADELGGRVDYWTTFNEPNGQIFLGYVLAVWSPGHGLLEGDINAWNNYRNAINRMIRAHRQAYRAIKQRRPTAQIGIAQHIKPMLPHDSGSADDHQDARDWDYVLQKQFLDAIAPVYDTGYLGVPAYAQPSRSYGLTCWDSNFDYTCERRNTAGFLDFVGINYYNPAEAMGSVAGIANPGLGDRESGGIYNSRLSSISRLGRPANDFPEHIKSGGPWEIYPEGLLGVLRDVWSRYRLPVMITENGLAESGRNGLDCARSNRPAFIVSHLQMVLQAIREGIPVLGYIHWTLVDNFEWREAYDTRAKFGLFHVALNREFVPFLSPSLVPFGMVGTIPQSVDLIQFKGLEETASRLRTETLGATAFREVIQAHAITGQILARWGSFPRITGDKVNTTESAVKSDVASVEIDPFGQLRGLKEFVTVIPRGARIVGVDLMYTDQSGDPLAQSLALHQGGSAAYINAAFLAVSTNEPLQGLEIVESHPGTDNGRVVVAWFRHSRFDRFDFRVFYRIESNGDSRDLACDPRSAKFITSGSLPSFMLAGQTYPVTVTLRNTGLTAWDPVAGYALSLGLDRSDRSFGIDRVPVPSPVPSGGEATFSFSVKAPSPGFGVSTRIGYTWQMTDAAGAFGSPTLPKYATVGDECAQVKGTIAELKSSITFPQGELVVAAPGEKSALIQEIGASEAQLQLQQARLATVCVPPQAAQFVMQSVPTQMIVGQSYPVTVTMRNAGTEPWAPLSYWLGSQNPQDNVTWGFGRVDLAAPVQPGQQTTFSFVVKAPATPGSYWFQSRMKHDDGGAFGDFSPNVFIQVTALPPPPPPPVDPFEQEFCFKNRYAC